MAINEGYNFNFNDLRVLSNAVVVVRFSLLVFLFETETIIHCNNNRVSNILMHLSDFLQIPFYEIILNRSFHLATQMFIRSNRKSLQNHITILSYSC